MILLWAKLKGYLAAIGTALAILAGVFFYGQRAGRSAAKYEQGRSKREGHQEGRGRRK